MSILSLVKYAQYCALVTGRKLCSFSSGLSPCLAKRPRLDPPDSDVMTEKPRRSGDSIFSGGLLTVILFRGMLIGLTTIAVFSMLLTGGASLQTARTGALAALILTQLIHVFECKSERRTLLHIPFFNNLKLIGAVCVSLAVMSFAIWHPVGQMIFETVALSAQQMRLIGLLLLAAPLLWALVSGGLFAKKEPVMPSREQNTRNIPYKKERKTGRI